jgi:membrane protease YdiL (CAAX protease family)
LTTSLYVSGKENIIKTIKLFIKTHPVLTYYILTFAISWGVILILVGPGGIPVTTDFIERGLAMLLGPSVAGILLTGLASGRVGLREILSRLLRWRVSACWYAVAILTAPLLATPILLALSLLSPKFHPGIFTSADKASLLLTSIVAGLMVGLFEELGWTAFAVPRLRLRYGVLATGLILGVIWGAWHFLLFWENDSFSGALSLALLLGRLFSWRPAYRVLMVWVYDRTGSLLVAILMHLSLIASMVIFDPPLTGRDLLTYILVRAAVLWVVVAVVAVAQRRAA